MLAATTTIMHSLAECSPTRELRGGRDEVRKPTGVCGAHAQTRQHQILSAAWVPGNFRHDPRKLFADRRRLGRWWEQPQATAQKSDPVWNHRGTLARTSRQIVLQCAHLTTVLIVPSLVRSKTQHPRTTEKGRIHDVEYKSGMTWQPMQEGDVGISCSKPKQSMARRTIGQIGPKATVEIPARVISRSFRWHFLND